MTRAVLDTNVVLASQRSVSPLSPNVEIVQRWQSGEFQWLFTDDIIEEYAEKLIELGITSSLVRALLARLLVGGERVDIAFFHLRHYPVDPDDTAFLLAALNGNATHLVTYHSHLEDVGVFYPEFSTCQPLAFLIELRAGTAP